MKNRPIISPFSIVLTSLKAGFEFATRYWWLAIFPFLLDLLFWLGPRLSVAKLWEQSLKDLGITTATIDSTLGGNLAVGSQELIKSINLMTLLSPPIFGLPTLMSIAPKKLPITPLELDVTANANFFLIYLLLTVTGIVISGLHLSFIAFLVKPEQEVTGAAFGRVYFPKITRYILFALLALVLLFIALIPTSIVFALTTLIHPILMTISVVFLFTFLTWMTIFFAFAIPNLFLRTTPLLNNFTASITFMRKQILVALPFVLSTIIITQTTTYLWQIADGGSWLTLVNLVGHAYVGTALIAATFLFYQERSELQTT